MNQSKFSNHCIDTLAATAYLMRRSIALVAGAYRKLSRTVDAMVGIDRSSF